MVEESTTWAWWMTALAVIAVLLIFGTALYWVNALRDGNRSFRFWQKRGRDPAPRERQYPGTRDDLL